MGDLKQEGVVIHIIKISGEIGVKYFKFSTVKGERSVCFIIGIQNIIVEGRLQHLLINAGGGYRIGKVELIHPELVKDGCKIADMVFVRMGCNGVLDIFDVMAFQIFDDILFCGYGSAVEHNICLTALNQNRVLLAGVDDMYFEVPLFDAEFMDVVPVEKDG